MPAGDRDCAANPCTAALAPGGEATTWMEVDTDDATIRERATSVQDAHFLTVGYIERRGRDD